MSDSKLLELQEVDKSFGGLRVIAELDLVVREHEIVSVIGPNGAGKTTLFNLITGIYRPDSGSIPASIPITWLRFGSFST